MARFEKPFEFSDAQAMPNATSVISTNVISWVENLGFEAQNRPLWIVVTCNTVPTGTSFVAKLYRYTTTTITSGTLLMTSEIVVVAAMSANPRAKGAAHVLAVFPFPPRCDRDYLETDQSEYFGLVYTCAGDCSDGKVDAYVAIDNPLIHTTMRVESNI